MHVFIMSRIKWLCHQTNEFATNILFTNIMYIMGSIDVKYEPNLRKIGGDEAVDHEIDL